MRPFQSSLVNVLRSLFVTAFVFAFGLKLVLFSCTKVVPLALDKHTMIHKNMSLAEAAKEYLAFSKEVIKRMAEEKIETEEPLYLRSM